MKFVRKPWFWWCSGIVLGVVSLIWAAYRFAWFPGKTPWDWLSLLIIPFALALVALLFNQRNTNAERQIALDKQREDLLQAYLDRMSELLLEKGLRTSPADAEVRNIARVRTISVLIQLDIKRVGYVFTFLREAGLVDTPNPIISLKDADLSEVNWEKAPLNLANLAGANLIDAKLREANLEQANLSNAKLGGVDLTEADLLGANLREADLCEANLNKACLIGSSFFQADLREANLRGASLINVELIEAKFNGANLRGACLQRASLQKADLSCTDLTRVDFTDANLSKTNIKGAIIDKSQLTPEQIAQAIWN